MERRKGERDSGGVDWELSGTDSRSASSAAVRWIAHEIGLLAI